MPNRLISSLLLFYLCFLHITDSLALEKINRLGVGFSNQLKTDFPAISVKFQKNRTYAFGGLMGISTASDNGGQAIGLKIYRNIYDEPLLNFYFTGSGAFLNTKINSTNYTGFQIDIGFGSEFHITGLNSLGLSFEFGASATKKKEFIFQTNGSHFVNSAIHFYL